MKKSRVLVFAVCLTLVMSFFSGCAKSSNTKTPENGSKEVKLTFFNTSAEVNNQFEELFKVYHELHPNVTIELIPTPIGGQQLEKFQSLIASKTPATIANLDPGTIYQYKDKFLDLESERSTYEKIAQPGAIEGALLDGKFLGIPYTIQGYALLYNTRVVEQALGTTFDPSTIKTRNDLQALLEKIDAAGIPPVMIHGANWSLGAHYLGLTYSLQSKSVDENRKFVEGLKDGSINLSDNAAYNGLLDTFDLLKKYNVRKDDPLVADYAKDSADFATGKCALYFMGDWTWSQIGNLEGIDKEFGFIPVPISNNPDDYGNTQMAVSEPKLMAIDNSGSTPEQQAAAKEFLYWMLTSEEGQNSLVKDMGFNLPYKDVKVKSTNIPAEATSKYISAGKTIDIGVINYFPQDYWTKTGDSMCKYLANKIDRQQLTKEVQDYWKSVAGK